MPSGGTQPSVYVRVAACGRLTLMVRWGVPGGGNGAVPNGFVAITRTNGLARRSDNHASICCRLASEGQVLLG